MSSSFGYKALSLAVATALTATGAHAAGLDRSGQDVTAFLQDGTYAEFVYTYIDADVSGHDNGVTAGAATNNYVQGKATGDGAEAYDFFRFGVKADASDRVSVGVLYDEPFGAAVQYMGESNFVAAGGDATIAALTAGNTTPIPTLAAGQGALTQLKAGFDGLQKIQAGLQQIQAGVAAATAAGNTAQLAALQAQAVALQTQAATITKQILTGTNTTSLDEAKVVATRLGAAVNAATTAEEQKGEGTNVEIRTNNLTGLVGVKLGEKRNVQVYAGPALQRLTGEVHLRGIAYQGAQGYDAKISTDHTVGWVAGVAYSKPEIALKAALTYRSEIEHDTKIAEVFPAFGDAGVTTKNFSVALPESYNLDFQTGINPTTLLTAKVRYVPWSKFDIKPTTYTEKTGFPIVSYSDDQWVAEVGLGKKLNDKLAVSGSVGYDSGAGNPASTLGPIEGYWSLGLGAKYNVTPEWSVSVGGKYLKFGDATAHLPNGMTAGEFSDNDGYIAGVKLAYQAK